ncbi:MAG: hypothetical protein ACXADY_17670 [Candidatus Hodarchaeales archaeon]
MEIQKCQFQRNQTWLHQKLKNQYLSKVGGAEEVIVQIKGGKKYRIDVLDKQGMTAYEIHRSNFGMRFSEKIRELLQLSEMRIVIVNPVVLTQKVTRMNQGEIINVSYVNKRGDIYSFFEKLVRFKTEFNERMEFNVLFVKEHVFKEFLGFSKNGRRKYQIVQRDLISIQETKKFCTRSDFIDLLPKNLPRIFTNRELAERLEIQGGNRRKRRIPGCMTYSLCKLGILDRVGTRGRAHEFTVRTYN